MTTKHIRDIPVEKIDVGQGAARQVLIGPQEGPNFAMRRFTIQAGGHVPTHTNTVEHEQYVLRGRARIRIGADFTEVEPGSVVLIPADVPHNYHVVGDEPFEFLCMVPNAPDRTEFLE